MLVPYWEKMRLLDLDSRRDPDASRWSNTWTSSSRLKPGLDRMPKSEFVGNLFASRRISLDVLAKRRNPAAGLRISQSKWQIIEG